jgi:hypothetical protein
MELNEHHMVRTDQGWQRLEDYCSTGPRGSHLTYTLTLIETEDEIMLIELGERVANYVLDYELTGWDALLDLRLLEEQ